jgi:hypothetical protein
MISMITLNNINLSLKKNMGKLLIISFLEMDILLLDSVKAIIVIYLHMLRKLKIKLNHKEFLLHHFKPLL